MTALKTIRRHPVALGRTLRSETAGEAAAMPAFEARFAPVEIDLSPGHLPAFLADGETALRGGSPALLLTTTAVPGVSRAAHAV